jgi:pimeloyl-ACP methyl ester carboxylesterase
LAKELYIFSGLGADERVFQKLDFSAYSVVFIKWITPIENETIENYASRLLVQITSTRPILIGLSFGGMMAVEVAKLIETKKTLLIASAKTSKEIPFYYRFAGKLGIHKMLSAKLLKSSNFLTNWFFGARTRFDKQILKEILIDTDSVFLKWAIDKIVKWSNKTLPANIFHIHGTSDRILPIKFVNFDVEINNGGHLMTLIKPQQLNDILKAEIEK